MKKTIVGLFIIVMFVMMVLGTAAEQRRENDKEIESREYRGSIEVAFGDSHIEGFDVVIEESANTFGAKKVVVRLLQNDTNNILCGNIVVVDNGADGVWDSLYYGNYRHRGEDGKMSVIAHNGVERTRGTWQRANGKQEPYTSPLTDGEIVYAILAAEEAMGSIRVPDRLSRIGSLNEKTGNMVWVKKHEIRPVLF